MENILDVEIKRQLTSKNILNPFLSFKINLTYIERRYNI